MVKVSWIAGESNQGTFFLFNPFNPFNQCFGFGPRSARPAQFRCVRKWHLVDVKPEFEVFEGHYRYAVVSTFCLTGSRL